MDRNLYLLDPLEIKMIQEINTFGEKKLLTLFKQPFCFNEVKDFSSSLPVDLVILKDGHEDGYKPLIDDLNSEVEAIRGIIDEEHNRRRHPNEGDNDDKEEEWPRLGNYDNPDNPEPIFTQMDDDFFEDYDNFDDIYNDAPYSEWLDLRKENPFKNEDVIESLFIDNGVTTSSGRLNNFALIQLDARLGRIKWYLQRLNNGCHGCYKTNWSASTTGKYVVQFNNKTGKVKNRTIYLLIDVIQSVATASGVSRDVAIAETYVHEMIHAYYDNIKRANIINVYLQGVTELEEAMTEFGMLVFMSQYNSSFLTAAHHSVSSKLYCGDPNIQFYGLGAELFNNWMPTDPFNGKVLEVYQKIMPSPRLSIKLVNMYVHEARSSHFCPNKCVKMIHDIVDGFDRNIESIHKHYKYAGKEYGRTYRVIHDVLESYATIPGSSFSKMEIDFANWHPIYSPYGIFADRKTITDSVANNYDLRRPITLGDGTIIVVKSSWSNNKNGTAQTFFTQVKKLHKIGILPSSVDILA